MGAVEKPADALAPGARLGRYILADVIGWGGSGVVYEAHHSDLGKRVALKTLVGQAADDTDRARFLLEGRAACRIAHPCCVDVIDVGVGDGMPFLVMELLEGEDLSTRFRREGALSPVVLVDALLGVLDAVGSAHEAGVVHRDLKPANLFIARDLATGEQTKVLDFGIARVTRPKTHDEPCSNSSSGTGLVGTPYYVAPEQARRASDADARSDQYALGVILYEGLTGQRPFVGDSLFETLELIREGRCRPPRDIVSDIPEPFEAVVLRAMHRDPAERFPSVRALGLALAPFASEATRARWLSQLEKPERHPAPNGFDELARTATQPTRDAPAPRSRRAVVSLTLLAGALAAAAAAWIIAATPEDVSPRVTEDSPETTTAEEARAEEAAPEVVADAPALREVPAAGSEPEEEPPAAVQAPEPVQRTSMRPRPQDAPAPTDDPPHAGPLSVDEF